jgi:hypothetical protein
MRFFNFSFLIIIGLLIIPAGCSFDKSGLADISNVACSDNTLNGDETDVDCGGSCDKCESQKDCLINTDCISDFCNASYICELDISCLDATQNGNETDIDCGGSCDKCEIGKSCLVNIDCLSDSCDASYICSGPSCSDDIINGNETDVDCGGVYCDKCTTGQACLLNTDCISDFCNASKICEIGITCSDATQNGNETDIDCGGDVCSPCIVDDSCLVNSDCETLSCSATNLICLLPSCTDDATNGNETDLNCGGNVCAPCVAGKVCAIDADCVSVDCSGANICLDTSCTDSIHNANETDVDCGGVTCASCLVNEGCLINSDCVTDYCDTSGNGCQYATSCKDLLVQNGSIISGTYSIIPPTGPGVIDVYCEVQGTDAYTFYYVSGGLGTEKTSDTNTCDNLGLMMFVPGNENHYNYGSGYALALNISTGGDFIGPMGIYSPDYGDSDWSSECAYKKNRTGESDTLDRNLCNFMVITGGTWWASDRTDVSQPSGDYTANCWLGYSWDGNGDITFYHDWNCNYTYNDYMCMSIDDSMF